MPSAFGLVSNKETYTSIAEIKQKAISFRGVLLGQALLKEAELECLPHVVHSARD